MTGPTGSGKSTSLYAALGCSTPPRRTSSRSRIRSSTRSTGITQVQVAPKTGLTFADGLRAMVRADPDMIMVGEIRDRETAQIADRVGAHRPPRALHAAHQRRALGDHATDRDGDRAVPRRLGDSTASSAQRLARTLCSQCKQRTIVPASMRCARAASASTLDVEAYEPVGCSRCCGTGYKGRIGLYEVMRMTPEIRTLALERAPARRSAK